MQTYNWNAEDYKNHSQVQQKWARELIDKLNLKKTERILDLGCGDGKVTAEIASRVPDGSVIGVDSSESMIKLAKEHHSDASHPNLSFMLMDATQLSFVQQFDVIFSNAALYWVHDHKIVLEGVYRSLCSGGRILLQMGGKGNAEDILSVLGILQKANKWQPYFKEFTFPYAFYGTEEYTQWLKELGYDIKRVELIPKNMEHNGKSGLEGWIRTTWLPYTQRIPEKERDQFIRELVCNYIKKVPMDSQGKVHVDMVRLEVEALKKT